MQTTLHRTSHHARRSRHCLVLNAFAVLLLTALATGAADPPAQAAATSVNRPAGTVVRAPRPVALRTPATTSPGTNIGNAGVLTSAANGAGTIVSGSDDWWVVYPGTVGGVVNVKVTNQASSGGCTIDAWLDGTDGRDQGIQNVLISAATSENLTGTASGSDRYYLEVTPDGCTSPAPYTVTLVSGGGGTPPNPAAGAAPAGTTIANAWPPLQGHTAYPEELASIRNPDWYVLYKKPDTTLASIRVENTANGCTLDFVLLNTDGIDGALQSTLVDGDAAATFTVPGRETQDAQGRYFLTVSSDGCSGGGQPYSIEPEPTTEWQSPAKIKGGHVAAATSAANAWPPLAAHTSYSGALGSLQNPDWYILYKKPDTALATIRAENTAPGCTLDFVLYGSTGTGALGAQVQSTLIDGNSAATFTVPGKETKDGQGRYFMAVSSDGCSAAGQPYSLEPEPAAEWETPALKVSTLTLKKGTVNVAYSATIAVSEGKKPYTFTAKTALPPGLSLATATGVISGKPAKAGKFTVSVQITDSTAPTPKSVTDTFTINIAS